MTSGPSNKRQRDFEPTRFGRYTLLAPLSSGVMGELFLARMAGAPGLERFCVIKRMLPQFAGDKEFVDRFTAEARTLLTLSHGNIAQILDASVHEGTPFIALEFVDGKDLGRLVSRMRDRQLPVPLSFSLAVACRVLEALAHAHRKKGDDGRELNLVHRDVSPQNIVISYEGEVKVIDFGLAKSAFSTAKTNPGTGLLGLRSMSPEQARSQPVDRRADVYAMGLCLFELVTGQHPFEGLNDADLLTRVGSPRHVPASQLEPLCPQALSNAIAKALSVSPADRFQSADEFRGVLQGILQDIEPSAGAELLSRVLHDAFNAEYAQERKWLAGLRMAEAVDSDAKTTDEVSAPETEELPVVAGRLSRTGEQPVLVPESTEPLPSIMVDGVESEELPASAPMRKARAKQEPATANASAKTRPLKAPAKAQKAAPAPAPVEKKEKEKEKEKEKAPKARVEKKARADEGEKANRKVADEETQVKSRPADGASGGSSESGKKGPLGLIIGIVVTVGLVAAAWFGWTIYSEQFAVSTPVEAEAVVVKPRPAMPKVEPKAQPQPDEVAVPGTAPISAPDEDIVPLKNEPKKKPAAAGTSAKPAVAISEGARAFKALERDYQKLEAVNETVVKKNFRIEFNVLRDMSESNPNYLSKISALHARISAELAKPENQ